jgi:CspA family cold shock protein
MATGTIRWFSATKGYGFIVADNDGAELLFRAVDVRKASLKDVTRGMRVSYDLVEGRYGKMGAENLRLG